VKTGYDASDPSNFLEGARPFRGENRFILGTFERGITVYRQQIRALNLVYSLVEARASGRKVIPPMCRITVIGGGAFGSTVAAAAAFANFHVTLVERRESLLHLQRGCDTRWLHPRFYDWPSPEADSQMARLPFLDWTASSAGNVAVQIDRELTDLQSDALYGRLDIDLGISDLRVERTKSGLYEVRYRAIDEQYIRPCEVVIYAVGFGIESNHGNNDSYWRNDRYAQSDLNFKDKRIRYFISGFGDGGLVDIFRLTIRDFRYERIFDEMFLGQARSFFVALDGLRRSPSERRGSLYDKFFAFEQGKFAAAIDKAKTELRKRLRSDTAVTLNGTAASFRLGLSLRDVSFSNALLVYLLFRLGVLNFRSGRIADANSTNAKFLGTGGRKNRPVSLKSFGECIIRHGTDRHSALKAVDCGKAISFLISRSKFDTGVQIFPPGWWGQYTDPLIAAPKGQRKWTGIEYVPPLLMTHATTFVSTLASILGGLIDSRQARKRRPRKPNFRVTLHRITHFDGNDVFQQVTPYRGRVNLTGGVGRFFSVEGGIVGLACRTGSLVVAQKKSSAKFRKIWQLTELDKSGAKDIKPYVDSLLCCPFFAPEPERGSQRVILALFVDSGDPEFFDEATRDTISFACGGFVDLLESLHSDRMLRTVPGGPLGHAVQSSRSLTDLKNKLKELGVTFVDRGDKGWKRGVTFRTVRSLDLQIRYEDSPI
jgi:hypothetical protein